MCGCQGMHVHMCLALAVSGCTPTLGLCRTRPPRVSAPVIKMKMNVLGVTRP